MITAMLPFVADFTSPATEELEWRTSVSISIDGTESRKALWSVPRRAYTLQFTEAPGLNEGLLATLRANPDEVVVPLWHFSGSPPTGGLKRNAPTDTLDLLGDGSLQWNGVFMDESGQYSYAIYWQAIEAADSAPMVAGYPDPELTVAHESDEIATLTFKVRAHPFDEAVPAWQDFDPESGLPVLPDIVNWNEGVEETLTRDENSAESNTALFNVETRYCERRLRVNLWLPDDAAIQRLRSFLFHVQGRSQAFKADILDHYTGTWRLDSDTVAIEYEASRTATCSLTLKELP